MSMSQTDPTSVAEQAEKRGNDWVAEHLVQAADLLAAQGAGPFRAGAYRRAADTIVHLDHDVRAIAETGGQPALEALPAIGPSIAAAIMEMLSSGRWTYLERLKGTAEPEALFRSVPGIGPELAQRLHEALHVDSLEELEAAAHDGRLAQVPGFGPRRVAIVRNALAALLSRLRPSPIAPAEEPDVGTLLDVDTEYRGKAAAGTLRKIAPKRFNPTGEAWLPVLHTTRGSWHFTALFSNTALAHQLGRSHDWVVIFFHHNSHPEGRRTIVTETRGPGIGERVVRGREAECLALERVGAPERENTGPKDADGD